MQLLYVTIFGGLGCASRYLVTLGTQHLFGRAFPYGTLLVNVVGSFLLGLLLTLGFRQLPLSRELYMGLTVGFMGGFTTFSAFSYQSLMLFEEGHLWGAAVNILLNVVLCLLAVVAAVAMARQFAG